MRRFIVTLISLASVVLVLGAAAFWVRSYGRCECFYFRSPSQAAGGLVTNEFGLVTASGKLLLYRREATVFVADGITPPRGLGYLSGPRSDVSTILGVYDASKEILGFGICQPFYGRGGAVIVPICAPLLLGVIGLAATTAHWRRAYVSRIRRARGECPACGYDLRASKDRCPECGAMIETTPARA